MLSCNQGNLLLEEEKALVKSLNFDAKIINQIKGTTSNVIAQLPNINEETGEIGQSTFAGIYSQSTEQQAMDFILKNKREFRKKGHLIFLFEGAGNRKNIAVIKGRDELDILRYRGTNGLNYNLDNDDIVAKVEGWDAKYGANVIGCSRDWMHIEFDVLPSSVKLFADEVYEFCPDSVDQGVGSVKELQKAIVEMHGVWLWWD